MDDDARHDDERRELLAKAYGRDGEESRAAQARLAALDHGRAGARTAPAPEPRRSTGWSRRRVGVALLAIAVVAFAAGAVVAASAGGSGRSDAGSAASTSPVPASVLSRALARAPLPVDALPAAIAADLSGRSSRLLYDDDPTLVAAGRRWRVWVGTGENPAQLCLVATFDNVTDQTSCFPRADAFQGRFVLRARTADGTLELLVDDGAVAVQIT